MLKQLAEFGKFVEINGFRKAGLGDAKAFLEGARKELPEGVEVQLFDADLVATWQHLYFAALNALQAFKTKRNLSNSVAVETVLYASAKRQIRKALDFIGVNPGSERIAVLVLGDSADSVEAGLAAVAGRLGLEPDESVLEVTDSKALGIKGAFGVTDAELAAVSVQGGSGRALVDLVVEWVALLSTRL
jgi:tRNA threonylcarbamoyladenosine modification (KEOPS) complex Cgi121 subunit